MDALVNILDEFRSRVRSPIWGTIGLYVILLNWKAFYFLLFADVSIPEKFSFWDENVTHEWLIYYPRALGVVSVLIIPWIRVGLAWVNKFADRKLHYIQSTQRNDKKIHDLAEETKLQDALAREEAVREQQKINRAKRLQEAGEVGGEELINEIKKDREAEEDREYPELSEIEKWIVHIVNTMDLHRITLEQPNFDQSKSKFKHKAFKVEGKELFLSEREIAPMDSLELRHRLNNLVSLWYLDMITKDQWKVEPHISALWENSIEGQKIKGPRWFK